MTGPSISSRPSSVSPQQLDQEQAVADEAKARVDAFEKSMEISKLNHEFTRSYRPSTARSATTAKPWATW